MDEIIKEALTDIKSVIPLNAERTNYVKVVLEEVFMKGERAEMVRALKSLSKVTPK